MALVIQIILAVAVLIALATSILSAKNWHWSQVLLALGLFLMATGYAILAADVMRIHRNLRDKIPDNQAKLDDFLNRNEALRHGTEDAALMGRLFDEQSPLDESEEKMSGLGQLRHRLHMVSRERGRVWRGVNPAGPLAKNGQIEITISHSQTTGPQSQGPQSHGLVKDSIVFAFESGNPSAANPLEGPQYLGEFRVVSVTDSGAMLAPILRLNNRTGQRIDNSGGPWNLYETMPIDRHKIFVGLPEEALRQMLPPASVDEYLRHGTPATDDDDPWHSAWYNADGNRVGPEDTDQHETRKVDRPLRDYAYLFEEMALERVGLIAQANALRSDNEKRQKTLASAEQMTQFREQQRQALTEDLTGMQADRGAIQSHLEKIQRQLTLVVAKLDQTLAENSRLAERYALDQLALAQRIDAQAPQ